MKLIEKGIAKRRLLKLLVPNPRPCIQIEQSNLKCRVGEKEMNFGTTEVEFSTS
jgi:hypothetical protein